MAKEPQPVVVKPVIHDYNFDEKGSTTTSSSDARFTIAFKNGSSTSARVAWVQDGSLYFLNEEGRQQVIGPELIDRPATLRANREKNLYLQLPPG